MAKPSHPPDAPRLLVIELWALGDVVMALPFLRQACTRFQVTLVAKPHATPLLARFAPAVEHVTLDAPWTRFRGKYRLHQWPWRHLAGVTRQLRRQSFDFGVSARRDPRDHLLMRLSGARHRLGFSRNGSGALLHDHTLTPRGPHRADAWNALAERLALDRVEPPTLSSRVGRRISIHTGAAQATRRWPRARYEILAQWLSAAGWEVTLLDENSRDLDVLMAQLAASDRFIGNDSGPGHLAALLGVPTFTVFGPALPEHFAPSHPGRAVIAGAPCIHKPCQDSCRFAQPHCILGVEVEPVWDAVQAWLKR